LAWVFGVGVVEGEEFAGVVCFGVVVMLEQWLSFLISYGLVLGWHLDACEVLALLLPALLGLW
jgi:hypothetical protein